VTEIKQIANNTTVILFYDHLSGKKYAAGKDLEFLVTGPYGFSYLKRLLII
jgi:hypothetical protein